MFSIKINGSLEGYFKGASGLRQGDPLSPYIFMIAMEVFSACIRKSTDSADFKYHWRAKELKLHHLIFADDIFLFCKGEAASVIALNKGLSLFSSISGLLPNWNKSLCFLSGVSPEVTQQILGIIGFQLGSLQILYLGLPLITSKLRATNCQPLITKLCAKIEL